MKVLDLFSGIGGFSLGLERAGMETVAFCEIEEYPRKVLAKHWPDVPIYTDVRELSYERLQSDGITGINVITGGFPCQDISVAGNQKGIGEGTRSGLWSECARLLGEIRPDYAIFENVTALLSGDNGRWFQRVLFDISEVGYDAEWHCISASELGAHHHRDRVWIIAHPNSTDSRNEREAMGCRNELVGRRETITNNNGKQGNVPNTLRERLQGREKYGIFGKGGERWHKLTTGQFCSFGDISQVEPTICRGSDGIPDYAHRLKGLGNAVVPQIPQLIGEAIKVNYD